MTRGVLPALLAKDLRRDWRRLEGLGTVLALTGLLHLIAMLAISDVASRPGVAATLLWLPIVVGASLAATQGLAAERVEGTLDLLRLTPTSPVLHGVSRTIVDGATITATAAASLALTAALHGVPVPLGLVAAVALGAAGVTIVASVIGGIAGLTGRGGALAPVLVVPALLPHLQAALAASSTAIAEGVAATDALALLVGLDLVAAALAWFLWPSLIGGDA